MLFGFDICKIRGDMSKLMPDAAKVELFIDPC